MRRCDTAQDASRAEGPLLLLGIISFNLPPRLARRAAIRSLNAVGSSHDERANARVAVRFVMADDEVSFGPERTLMLTRTPVSVCHVRALVPMAAG